MHDNGMHSPYLQTNTQAYVYPPVMQLAPATTGPWSTGLCDCPEDCRSCWLTMLCPCVAFGRIAEALDHGTVPCVVSGSLYMVLMVASIMGCCCMCTFYSCMYRTKLRQQYLLEEHPCNDLLVHLVFEFCALCQEYRELQNRGYFMSLGWQGNVEMQRRMTLNIMQPVGLEGGMLR
ncbi:hypothetical protein K1719_033081 [Acacia pycnantha]|nr:hypothetical protein K1719_033081 [Acacia pycnantha]